MKKTILFIGLSLLLAGSVEAATINRDCFVCRTPSDFDEINTYYGESDNEGAGEMIWAGRCTPVLKGSKATVLDSKIFTSKTKVRVQGGVVGWTSSDFIVDK